MDAQQTKVRAGLVEQLRRWILAVAQQGSGEARDSCSSEISLIFLSHVDGLALVIIACSVSLAI
jgi:hypothetical protein